MGCHLRSVILMLAAACCLRAESYYVIVAGLGGNPEYESQFVKWAAEMKQVFEGNGPGSHVLVLEGEAATRQGIQGLFAKLGTEIKTEDSFSLFLVGHGTFDGTDYKFNVPGPDISAQEIAALLDGLTAKRQLVVNMSSCSGASVPALAHKDRIVITATKSGTEKNATVFPRYWIDALKDPAADADKNGVLSTLEVFRYTERKTAAYFESEKLLATEHPTLTDGLNAKAVRDPKPENGQGLLAVRFSLLRQPMETAESAPPNKQKLIVKKEELEARIDRLKYEKAAMAPEIYKQQLTALLLELAKTQAEIDR